MRTEAHRAALSAAAKRRFEDPQERAKIAQANRRRFERPGEREKIARARRIAWAPNMDAVLVAHMWSGGWLRDAAERIGVDVTAARRRCRELGIPVPLHRFSGGRPDVERTSRIVALRAAGMPVRIIAERIGLSPGAIYSRLAWWPRVIAKAEGR